MQYQYVRLSLTTLVCLLSSYLAAQVVGSRQDLQVGYDVGAYDLIPIDIDLDGDLDVIRLHSHWLTLYRQIGVGTGTYAKPEGLLQYASGNTRDKAAPLITEDLNGDGYPDVLIGNRFRLSDGQGGFSAVHTDVTFRSVGAVTDLDGDGDLDLVGSHAGFSNSFRGQYNNGSGRFHRTAPVLLPSEGFTVKDQADLNGDGREDFIMGTSESVAVFFRAPGSENWQRTPVTSMGAWDVVLGDLDGDGDLDFMVSSYAGVLSWIENLGGFDFAQRDTLTTGIETPDLSPRLGLGDLDRDGDLDLVFAEGAKLVRLSNDGTGGFAEREVLLTAPDHLPYDRADLIDFDQDGKLDILTSMADVNWGAHVYRQVSLDSFVPAHTFHEGLTPAKQTRFVDLNGDGNVELLEQRGSRWEYRTLSAGQLGDILPISGQEASLFIDLNQDGLAEIVSCESGRLAVFRNLTGMTWDAGTDLDGFLLGGQDIGYGDFDGDGDVDLFAANGSQTIERNARLYYYENDGGGNFQSFEIDHGLQLVQTSRAQDVDGDGRLDMVMTLGGSTQQIRWYRNLGNRQFEDQGLSPTGAPSHLLRSEYHDVDNDGDFDMVYSQKRNSIQDVGYLEQLDDGTFANRIIKRIDTNASYGFSFFTMSDFDLDGDLDCIVGSGYWRELYFMRNEGDGVFSDLGTFYDQNFDYSFNSLFNADINGDGVADVLLYHTLGGRPRLSWFAVDATRSPDAGLRGLSVTCYDNATPSQRDDYVVVAGQATGPSDSLLVALAPVEASLAKTLTIASGDSFSALLPPGSAGGGPISIQLQVPGATAEAPLVLNNPSCSSGPAEWLVLQDSVRCDINDSPDLNADDFLLHELEVRLYAPTAGNGVTVTSAAGQFQSVGATTQNQVAYGALTNSSYRDARSRNLGDSVSFLLRDVRDTSLVLALRHATPPATCSFVPTLASIELSCHDNQTVADSLDDRYLLTVNVSGQVNTTRHGFYLVTTTPGDSSLLPYNVARGIRGAPGSVYGDSLTIRVSSEDIYTWDYRLALPNRGCSNQASSILGFRQNRLRVFPNPVHQAFRLEGLPAGETHSYELYSLLGERVVQGVLNASGEGRLPPQLPSGMYVLQGETWTAPLAID